MKRPKPRHYQRNVAATTTAAAIVMAWCLAATHALLLSNVPTPSLVLDMQALERQMKRTMEEEPPLSIPRLGLVRDSRILTPTAMAADFPVDLSSPPLQHVFGGGEAAETICYLHSSVTRPREAAEQVDTITSSFLAEIDLGSALCNDAKLVLGLNNHHVGSYYWARSAGAGASMDAPGVVFDTQQQQRSSPDRAMLTWASAEGPQDCNSNDGKRSEWVNFLRPGDHVQLVPDDPEATLLRFCERFKEPSRVYGISFAGRPLGSEPAVVCSWQLV